jgi:hypothetical protein
MSETPPLATVTRRWRITLAVLGVLALLTKHYPLHKPEHVGMFAGSLLQRGDWDH